MTPDARFAVATALLDEAAAAGVFPAAVAEAGSAQGAEWQRAAGRLTFDATAPACTLDTVFDLASLTKVIATTPIWMRLVAAGRLGADDLVREWSPPWDAADRRDVALTRLLDHSSGLPAHARLFERISGRHAYEVAIGDEPLAYRPGERAVYSDLGFMLLGIVLERAGGATLDALFAPLAEEIGESVAFLPPVAWRDRIAPTELDPWRGRLIVGEVHDENAAALGGVAGHAGLFGTAAAVGAFARLVLRTFRGATSLGTPDLMRRVAERTGVPGSSRALGWDTALPTSSCGAHMPPTAIGHTGFTGTSLWIDWEHDRYAVLLTNRVHPTRANDALVRFRPRFHDALAG